MKRITRFVRSLLLVAFLSLTGNAGADTAATVQLYGLREIPVVVVMKDFSHAGPAYDFQEWTALTKRIGESVTRQLAQAGFSSRVIETVHDIFLNTFEIHITLESKTQAAYLFCVLAGYRDDVLSKRIPKLELPEGGITWQSARVGYETKDKLSQAIIDASDSLTMSFVSSLLFENGGEMQEERERSRPPNNK